MSMDEDSVAPEYGVEQDERPEVKIPDALPVLPLRATVLYPSIVMPLVVGQERSVKLVDDAMRADRLFVAVTQRNPEARPAAPGDLYRVGTVAAIQQLLRAQDGTLRLIVQGVERVRVIDFISEQPYLIARIERAPERVEPSAELEALVRSARDLFERLVRMLQTQGGSEELIAAARSVEDPVRVAYLVASVVPVDVQARQDLLEFDEARDKLRRVVEILQHELAVRELERQIATETSEKLSKDQREYFLRRQLETIQRELGEGGAENEEIRTLRERLAKTPLSDEARREAERELARLERVPDASPEHGMIRTYLDWLLALPWGKFTGGRIDVARARQVLDEDHYDLDKIKERILDYLATKKLRDERGVRISPAGGEVPRTGQAGPLPQVPTDETWREPILCFVGPPGVGKTSLGQSIARAMGRQFVRISLGGVHDESEIRGHRRTYIGAMPGRIIQALCRVGVADPVFMLDEVDKLGVGLHGDPSAALLEVLDPAQNRTFVDTYLGVAFDLSNVLFICTANTTDTIPAPLLDRMELIRLAGYTERERENIARKYLLPKQMRAHGLLEGELLIDDEALRRVVREYTREAGVRGLERELATIARKAARRISEGATPPVRVSAENVPEFLGPPRVYNEVAERTDRPGVATGLAWTPTGGEVLFVEATMMPSNEERLVLTGMLGDVMRESAMAALSYVRSNAERLGIDARVFDRKMVHVHVPAGAIPKDGPSAGVTMLTALASIASGRPVRSDVAMTGEITLRGKVLPVGGIRDKVLAAHRAGIKRVILPRQSERELEDVPEEVRRDLEIILVDSADEVLDIALAPSTTRPAPQRGAAPGPVPAPTQMAP